ncbi:hypothetical protein GNI_109700, partial [Gregarina niphandrodes]
MRIPASRRGEPGLRTCLVLAVAERAIAEPLVQEEQHAVRWLSKGPSVSIGLAAGVGMDWIEEEEQWMEEEEPMGPGSGQGMNLGEGMDLEQEDRKPWQEDRKPWQEDRKPWQEDRESPLSSSPLSSSPLSSSPLSSSPLLGCTEKGYIWPAVGSEGYQAVASVLRDREWAAMERVDWPSVSGTCTLQYLESAAMISSYYSWPFGRVEESLASRLRPAFWVSVDAQWREEVWLTACLLQRVKASPTRLADFCAGTLGHDPIPVGREAFREHRVTARPVESKPGSRLRCVARLRSAGRSDMVLTVHEYARATNSTRAHTTLLTRLALDQPQRPFEGSGSVA